MPHTNPIFDESGVLKLLSGSYFIAGCTFYAIGSFTVATGTAQMLVKRMTLSTTQRVTLTGTARLRIMN